jgi:peroxiredoxin Q/BCP
MIAPDFEATDHKGRHIRLSEFQGKRNVVLYFYPWDDTPGCTKEACSFRDNMSNLDRLEAEVIGISTNNAESHGAFAQKYELQFSLIPDPEKKIGGLYGVPDRVDSNYGEVYRRVTFVIGKNGTVVKVYPQVDVTIHSKEIEQALSRLD